MRHDILNQYMGTPAGFSSYSTLLVPAYEWFETSGIDHAYRVFSHFKRVGQLLGDDHLAFWFYRSFFGYGRGVDSEVVVVISDHLPTVEQLAIFTQSRFEEPRHDGPRGGHDVGRARLLCAVWSLDYSRGPYVALFTERPTLPYHSRILDDDGVREVIRDRDSISTPARILSLGGLSLSRTLHLLDELERSLLSRPHAIGRLAWKARWLHLEQWCSNNRDVGLRVLKIIVLRKIDD